MKRLVEFPLEEGGFILVEVEEQDGGIVQVGLPGEIAARAAQTFDAALERIKPVAKTIVAKLRSLSDPPDEMQVEFGLKLSAEGGPVIASAGAEANFTVTLTWKREKKAGGKKPAT